MSPDSVPATTDEIVTATRTWLERAVIGLNLCPFAKAVHVQNRIRYFVSSAQSTAELLEDLAQELHALHAADPNERETTLLLLKWEELLLLKNTNKNQCHCSYYGAELYIQLCVIRNTNSCLAV